MRGSWSLAALTTACLVWAASPVGARPGIRPLENPPQLFFTAETLADGESFVTTDLMMGSLRVYSMDGELLRSVRQPGLGGLEWNRPALLSSSRDGFVLQDTPFHLVFLDRALVPQDGFWMPGGPGSSLAIRVATAEGSVSQVVMLGALATPSDLVVRADVEQAGRWRSGIWRLDRKDRQRLEPLIEGSSEPNDWYVYDGSVVPALAAVGERLFFLRADQTMALEQLLPERKTLPVPPPYTGKLPPLAHLGGRERSLELHAAFSRLSLVRSIHSWEGSLYLLGARFTSGLAWELWRWDDKAGWRGPLAIDLPAETREVVLAPGPKQWFLVLQGARPSVEGQKVLGLTLLEAAKIRAALR